MAQKRFLVVGVMAAALVACSNSDDSLSDSDWDSSSSSSEINESSSSVPEGYVDPSTVVKGTMTDERDGQTYKTVTIGTQTWMAENLNYAGDSSGFCYNDSVSYCEKYGRLYTWAAAMDSVGTWTTNGKGCGWEAGCLPTYPVRGICPEGWHLPTLAEFKTLEDAVGGWEMPGKMLKSTSGWKDDEGEYGGNGMDAYGFSALPSSERCTYLSKGEKGSQADFWSSNGDPDHFAGYVHLDCNDDYMINDYDLKSARYSVRCVKDEVSEQKSSSSVTPSSSVTQGPGTESGISSVEGLSSSETSVSSSSSAESSSSSAKLSSSSVVYVEPCRTDSVDTCEYGTLTDERDGKTYKTVKIGSQTWMAENLNYESAKSWCYGKDSANCTKYGRLYTWAAAMDSVGTWSTNGMGCGFDKKCSSTYPVRGVCPSGWHLPKLMEWNTLFTAVGGLSVMGKMLKSTSGWDGYNAENGTDGYSFAALPAGYRASDGICYSEGSYADFWCSDEYNSDEANYICLNLSHKEPRMNDYKGLGFSVRCVKDE